MTPPVFSRIFKTPFLCGGAFFVSMGFGASEEQTESKEIQSLLQSIQVFEGANDPKCHATASRLENFIFGTPLSDEARFQKNELVTGLVQDCWQLAHRLATQKGDEEISEETLNKALEFYPPVELNEEKSEWIIRSGAKQLSITKRDQKHYSSVAYALRAILAVQQGLGGNSLKPLSKEALTLLKTRADLYQLAALKLSDHETRKAIGFRIQPEMLMKQWKALGLPTDKRVASADQAGAEPLIPALVKQKLASYAKYNDISNQLFVRNLQVYFAKRRWPATAEEGKALKEGYATAVINYALDVYVAAQKIARDRGDHFVREKDIHHVVQQFTPYEVNEFEDVIFFPRLSEDRVKIEAYDLDAFRDGGLHWRYLGFALNESRGAITMDADPFAAELLAEAISQFGVLTWRIAGEIAIKNDQERLALADIESAMVSIQSRINMHLQGKGSENGPAQTLSSEKGHADARFVDRTKEMGITGEHRSSDWLSRLLRSYLDGGENRGIITIPPAFGGSGMAAEDIDNDGDVDLLILSGTGNRLFQNEKGKMIDITAKAGLVWNRVEDGRPGEPRQPVIVDFDNDGWQDILITYVNDEHRLYRNKGDGTFADVTGSAGLGGKGLVGGPATVFDFDQDGKLDIYIGYFGNYLKGTLPTLERRNRNGLPNQLFRNLGGMRFENVTSKSGTGDSGWGQAVGHTDFDNDGWQDLIVGNDFGVNSYFRNNGDGTFEEISKKLGTDKPSYTMGIGISDLNRDQAADIYISNIVTMNKDEKYVLPNQDTEMKFDAQKLANMRVVEANDLFLSKPSGGYELSKLVDRGYSSTGWAWDADFFDFDHDGDDDLYVLNGMNDFNVYSRDNPYYQAPSGEGEVSVTFAQSNREKNVLFANEGGRLQAQENSGLELLSNSRSAVFFDPDGDGDLDIAVNNYQGPVSYLRNEVGADAGRWLKIRLQGNPDKGVSRDAIGARLIAKGKSLKPVWREVHSTVGYLSGHPKEQHFGVKNEATVNLTIIWPNGETQVLAKVATNQIHSIKQP